MPFSFSCAQFTFPLLSPEKAFDLIALLDFEGVDLALFEGRSHHQPSAILQAPEAQGESLRSELGRRRLRPADVFLQTGPRPAVKAVNAPDPSVRADNRKTVEGIIVFARALGATHITGLPGVCHQGGDEASDWARAVEETHWRVDACREAGITYAVEPHMGSILADPETVGRFLEAVPGLTLTLDYGHFICQGMPNERIHPLLPRASHFHARGATAGALQCPVSENTVDYPAVLERLSAAGYRGWICLEYVWNQSNGCNRTDNLSETLLLRDALRRGPDSPLIHP